MTDYLSPFSVAPLMLVAPTEFPVSLEQVKAQCRIDHNDDDYLLNLLIEAATGHLQRNIGRLFTTQTWQARYDSFEDVFELPFRPIQSIDRIQYANPDDPTDWLIVTPGIYTHHPTATGYVVHLDHEQSWPIAHDRPHAIAIDVIAGYGAPEDVPAEIRQSILVLVSTLYENRENIVIGQTVQSTGLMDALISTHRVFYV